MSSKKAVKVLRAEPMSLSPEAYAAIRAAAAAQGIALPAPISGGAIVPLAAALIPLIPGLVNGIVSIVRLIRSDPGVPDEQKAALDALSARLDATAEAVAALEIRAV